MNIFFLITTLFLNLIYLNNYQWPTDQKGAITTTFAEPRSNRFHAGIDFRTYGKIGSNIYAVESGYIIRIKIMPNNYGKAIYLKLNDGNTILYSHLDKFNPEIEMIVRGLQEKYNLSFFDHTFSSKEIKVQKGDVIGFSGDTGTLSGPHLHFEIRDTNGQPINPLINYFDINDSLSPIAKSLSFIPLNTNTSINNIQDYQTYNLEKVNSYKYVLTDTISIVGKFGLAIETWDEINNLPFKFGIYKIDLLIDNIKIYSIEFDKYNFKENPLVNTEIDYVLSEEGNISHRLFNNKYNLSFIKSANNGHIILEEKHHNILINIIDNNKNISQVQGIITGRISENPEISISHNKNGSLEIETLNNQSNIFFNIVSPYKEINQKDNRIIEQMSENKYLINNYNSNYDVLEYFSIDNFGVISDKSYVSINKLEPYNIKGQFNLKYIESGLIIEFKEDVFSGYLPTLEIESINNKKLFSMYRKNKNLLSSALIEPIKIKKISLIYDTNPEIVFEKQINNFLPNQAIKSYTYNNFIIKMDNSTFYNNGMIWIEEDNLKLNRNYNKISDIITIKPSNIPFKKPLFVSYDANNCNSCGFYKLNKKDNKWSYIDTYIDSNSVSAYIKGGGTFCIYSELDEPDITNLSPAINAIYRQEDLKIISFNLEDKLSGINPFKIQVKLDDENLYFDYIPYRNIINIGLNSHLSIGYHQLNILVYDNLNNIKKISGEFKIIE